MRDYRMENASGCIWVDMTRRHTKQFNSEAARHATKRGYSGSAEQQNSQPLWPKAELLTCVWFGEICVVFAVPESVALAAQVDEFIERAHAGAVAAALGYGRYHAVERGKINVPFADSSATQPSHVVFSDDSSDRPDMQEQLILGRIYRLQLANKLRDVGYEIFYVDQAQGFFEIKDYPLK